MTRVVCIISDPWGIRIEHNQQVFDITLCPGEKGVVLREAQGRDVPEEVSATALSAFTDSALLMPGPPTTRAAGAAIASLLRKAPRRFEGKQDVLSHTPAGVTSRLNKHTDLT